MKIIESFIRNITYPFWMIYDGDFKGLKYINYFNYIDSFNRLQLLESQRKSLQKILIYAYENTDYYNRLFNNFKFQPYKNNFIDSFKELPILTKNIVKNNYIELISKGIPEKNRIIASTGGSTGIPMKFLRNRESQYLRRAQELYFDKWLGYRIGKKVAYFVSGSHFDGNVDLIKYKLRNATSDRMLSFDPYHITDGYMKEFSQKFKQYKPDIIKCFPNALVPFVNFINRENISVPKVPIISCTGENLYRHQREQFKYTFDGEVFEKVGTRESGVIASECKRHNGLHIFTEGVFIEIVKENGDEAKEGEMGKVIITDLFNKAMPLIRYEIGDMAISAGDKICDCGSELPLIEKYLGRRRDIILDSNGSPKPGYLFVEVVKDLNLNTQIQIIQLKNTNIIVNVVKQKSLIKDVDLLIKEFKRIVGSAIDVKINYVDKIDRDPSGKFSYVKSMIR